MGQISGGGQPSFEVIVERDPHVRAAERGHHVEPGPDQIGEAVPEQRRERVQRIFA